MALSEAQLMALPSQLHRMFAQLEIDIVATIAKHLGDMGRLTNTDIIKLNELQRLGYNMRAIQSETARVLQRAESEVYEIFRQAAEIEHNGVKTAYDLTGNKWVPFAENQQLQDLVQSISRAAYSDMANWSHTMGFNKGGSWLPMQEWYAQKIDYAVLQARTGQGTIWSGMRQAVVEMADSGVTVIEWASGYRRRVDSSARMNILGGLAKLNMAQAEMTAEEIGADGMEITWHNGYRPSHDWGGIQFSMKDYENDIKPQMEEPNCYHRAFPILLGISTPAYTEDELREMREEHDRKREFEGREYNQYEAEQQMRRIETAIRKQKECIHALEAAGIDNDEDKRKLRIAKGRLQSLNGKYGDFSGAMGLKPKPNRVSVPKPRVLQSKAGQGIMTKGGDIINSSAEGIVNSNQLNIATHQFGKKVGKHASDYGLNPKKEEGRNKMRNIIFDIVDHYDEIREGEFRGQSGSVRFYIKGDDVVIVSGNNFVSILKDGSKNKHVQRAIPIELKEM